MTTDRPIILFDGVCNLCNASVRFVIGRDRRSRFQFASLQSDAAKHALENANATAPLPDSVVLIDAKGVHTRSTAALRIARGLGFPYSIVAIFVVVPRPIRDALYRWIARHRYKWFGRSETCMAPSDAHKDRFLDANENG